MKRVLERILYVLCIAVTVWIVGCLLFYNDIWENNRLLLFAGSIMGVLLFGQLGDFVKRKEVQIEKYYKVILTVFLLVYGILLFFIGCKMRFEPVFDLEAIYGGAREWYLTGDFEAHKWYFYRNRNNMGGLVVLYISNLVLGWLIQDFFLIAVLTNIVGILITIWALSLSSKELWGYGAGVLSLAAVAVMLPFLFMGAAFYTDVLSMPYVTLGLYIFLILLRTVKLKNRMLLSLLLGAMGCMGFWIKGTALIVYIAGMIVLLLRKKLKTAGVCLVGMAAGFFIVTLCLNGVVYEGHLTDTQRRKEAPPSAHWVMMGLAGNGMYNPQDFEFTYSFSDEEERAEAINEEILLRMKERGLLGMLKLFADKTVIDYGEGTLGLSDFLDDTPQKECTAHKYVLYGGHYYSQYRAYCSILILVYLIYFLFRQVFRNKTEKLAAGELLIAVGFLGIFALLMMWESSYRYFTNYMPLLLIGAAGGIVRCNRERFIQTKEALGHIEPVRKAADVLRAVWKKRSVRVFSYAVLFRLVMYVIYLVIMVIEGDYQGYITFADFLEAWKRWDASHYLNIAENGYGGAIEDGKHLFLVFYPLYPWLIDMAEVFVGDYRLAGIWISLICYGIGSVYLDKLLRLEFDKKVAENAALALAVYPFAFFFGGIMTESLFFAITAAFFYYLRKHKWFEAALVGFLACLTKVQGMLLTLAVIVEVFSSYRGVYLLKQRKWKAFFRDVIGNGLKCVPMVGGTLVYLLVNFIVEGDPFRFMYYQKNHWGNSLCPMWETVSYISKNVMEGWYTSTGMCLWVPEFILFFVYLAAIWYGWKKKLPSVYMVYLVSFFVLTYSSTWLISGGRYTLSALPLFMLAGKFLSEHEKVKKWVIPLSFALMVVYMTGYFQWKQIM